MLVYHPPFFPSSPPFSPRDPRRLISPLLFLLRQGDEVCRAVWMQDTGARPYPRPKRRRGGVPGVAPSAPAPAPAPVPAAAAAVAENANFQEDDVREIPAAEGAEEDEGPAGLVPYPLRAAAILEDAYQFLAWHLECGGGAAADGGSAPGAGSNGGGAARGKAAGRGHAAAGGSSSSSPTVLLTVQVSRACGRGFPSSARPPGAGLN